MEGTELGRSIPISEGVDFERHNRMCRCKVHRGVVSASNMYTKHAHGAIAQTFLCQKKKVRALVSLPWTQVSSGASPVKADPEGLSKQSEGFPRDRVSKAQPAGSDFRVSGLY